MGGITGGNFYQSAQSAMSSPIPIGPLLVDTYFFLERYIHFPHDQAATVASLWIAHTHVFDCFDETPYLHISSPVKRCGKSRLLKCLNLLCARPWSVISPSEAVVYRKIERDKPTFLLDEVDTIYNSHAKENAEALRALLNAGFERNARVPRCVGGSFQLVEFAVYCPKALAGIGRIPDTVADRSFMMAMKRKPPNVTKERFIARDVLPDAQELAAQLKAWGEDDSITEALRNARPAIPNAFDDRAADISVPLLAIADLAGGNWPTIARHAIAEICDVRLDEDESTAIQLLRAIREIFTEKGVAQIPTHDLLDALMNRENEPWASWWEAEFSRGNTRGPASKLARILKPFEVVSQNIKQPDGSVPKGYKLESFQEAFATYST